MIFDKQENTTVITQESVSLPTFLSRFKESYPKFKNDNLILNLLSLSKVSSEDLLNFLQQSNSHRDEKKSFVIVTNTINFSEVHDNLIVVPTLQEAFDIVEMDEIERDLDF